MVFLPYGIPFIYCRCEYVWEYNSNVSDKNKHCIFNLPIMDSSRECLRLWKDKILSFFISFGIIGTMFIRRRWAWEAVTLRALAVTVGGALRPVAGGLVKVIPTVLMGWRSRFWVWADLSSWRCRSSGAIANNEWHNNYAKWRILTRKLAFSTDLFLHIFEGQATVATLKPELYQGKLGRMWVTSKNRTFTFTFSWATGSFSLSPNTRHLPHNPSVFLPGKLCPQPSPAIAVLQ